MERIVEALKSLLPKPLRKWLSQQRRDLRRKLLPFDRVTDFSELRRLKPYRPAFGWHRGKCIDRYYIEAFLAAHQEDIYGHVLEVGSDEYTRRFGGARVTLSDVVDVDEENQARTITGDLTHCHSIHDDVFDCIICVQTLPFIYDVAAAIRELHRIVKPAGVVLATLPGIAKICERRLFGAGEDYWRFTCSSARRLFGESFGEANIETVTYGNVLAAISFLHGLVVSELTAEELDHHDPEYQVTVAVRARKLVTQAR
jgi:SAM-dependent methyltransferase